MDHQFRSAALGGFHKQDVLDYLELTAREHKEETASLREQLEQLQARLGQLEEKADVAEQVEQENQQLKQTVTRLQEQLTACQQENENLRAQNSRNDQTCRQLQEEIDKLGPAAAAYAAVKERTAGVELDAHRRAQAVIDQAQMEANQIHSQMEQWLGRVDREYTDLRGQVNGAVANATEELNRACGLLEQITTALRRQDSALEELEKTYARCEVVTVPAPMPIPEE